MRRRNNRKNEEPVAEHPPWTIGFESFLRLDPAVYWAHFKSETLAFKAICAYMFFEYVRPQSIITQIDILPWSQLFLILSLVGALGEKRKTFVSDPANKWLIIFFAVILYCSVTAYWPGAAYKHLFDYYSWVIIYFLIINIVNTKERLFIFLTVFFLSLVKVSVFGAKTWTMRGFAFTSWGLKGPPGYFENSGELAIQMLMYAFISYQFLDLCKPWLSRNKYIFLFLLFPVTGMMTVMGSSSRGGQLALLASLLFFFRKKLNFRRIILLCVLLAVGYWLLPAEQKQRFEEMGEDKTSQQRLLYWKNGLDMWENHKLTGVGYYNYIPYYEVYYREDMLYDSAQLSHNIFVQVMAELGSMGLLVYLILMKNAFLLRKKVPPSLAQDMATGFNAAFLGYLIAGQFVTVVYYPFMWIHLAMAACIRNIDSTESLNQKYKNNTRRNLKPSN